MAMCAFKCDWYATSTSGYTWQREWQPETIQLPLIKYSNCANLASAATIWSYNWGCVVHRQLRASSLFIEIKWLMMNAEEAVWEDRGHSEPAHHYLLSPPRDYQILFSLLLSYFWISRYWTQFGCNPTETWWNEGRSRRVTWSYEYKDSDEMKGLDGGEVEAKKRVLIPCVVSNNWFLMKINESMSNVNFIDLQWHLCVFPSPTGPILSLPVNTSSARSSQFTLFVKLFDDCASICGAALT